MNKQHLPFISFIPLCFIGAPGISANAIYATPIQTITYFAHCYNYLPVLTKQPILLIQKVDVRQRADVRQRVDVRKTKSRCKTDVRQRVDVRQM